MAYFDDLNNVSPVSQAVTIYDLKEAMKAAGYTIRGSGDGIAAHSAVGDVITNSGSGANGMNNTNAWFTVRQGSGGAAPYSGTREWTFQRGTQPYNWFCQYSSPNTTFDQTTGNATTRPTLLLPVNLMNFTGSAVQTTILPTALGYTYQIRVGDSAEDFHWYCIAYANGGGAITSRIANVPMASDSITSAEDDPFILTATTNNLLDPTLAVQNDTNAMFYGWQGLNSATGYPLPLNIPAQNLWESGVVVVVPNNLGSNPENGQDDGIPIPWGRATTSATTSVGAGFKGFSQKVKWTGTNRVTGDTFDSLNYILFDDTIWEWDGSTVPSV